MTDLLDHKSHIVVLSFTHNGFTYFLGSASRVDLPFTFTNGMREYRMDLRMTRICNLDGTRNLESRIDIILNCDLPGFF